MKNILILNASPRKDGNTNRLLKSFKEGISGHNIIEYSIYDMNINGCVGCNNCASSSYQNPCIQDDDMKDIYSSFIDCDIVVFVSPVYYWTITGPLKTVADRLYAVMNSRGYKEFEKESVLIMTAGSYDYSQAVNWYKTYESNLNWNDLGMLLGINKISEAKKLGKSII